MNAIEAYNKTVETLLTNSLQALYDKVIKTIQQAVSEGRFDCTVYTRNSSDKLRKELTHKLQKEGYTVATSINWDKDVINRNHVLAIDYTIKWSKK